MNLYWPIIMDNHDLREKNPFINEHFRACEHEMRQFKIEKGLIRDRNFIDWVDCPVCGSSHSEQLFVKWGGRYDECKNCTHVYLRNPLKEKYLLELYKTSIADQLDKKVQLESFNFGYWQAIYTKYMLHLAKSLANYSKIIDVGCGSGQFLRYCAENHSYDLYALDIYSGLAATLPFLPEENVFEVDSFSQVKLESKFALVTLWGVLEHLRDPHAMFDWCAKHLSDNGLILILIPNLNSRARKILGVFTPTLNPREHINFLTASSLVKVISEYGFRIRSHSQELPIIDIMWDYVDPETNIIQQIVDLNECYYDIYIIEKIRVNTVEI